MTTGPDDGGRAPVHRWAIIEAGSHRCALDAGDVREVHDGCTIEPLAGTAHWFLGTATVHGRVLPVTDLERWLGEPARSAAPVRSTPDRSPPLRAIELASAEHRFLIAVDAVRLVSETGSSDEGDDGNRDERQPELIDAALAARGIEAASAYIDGQAIALLSAAALLRAPAFLDIRAAG